MTGLLVEAVVVPSPKFHLNMGPDKAILPDTVDRKLELALNLAFTPERTEGETVDE